MNEENQKDPPLGDIRAEKLKRLERVSKQLKEIDPDKWDRFRKMSADDTKNMIETVRQYGSPFLVIERLHDLLSKLPPEGDYFCAGCGRPATGQFFAVTLEVTRRVTASCFDPDCRALSTVMCRMNGATILFVDRRAIQAAVGTALAETGGKLEPETPEEVSAYLQTANKLQGDAEKAQEEVAKSSEEDLRRIEKIIRERN